MKNKRSLKARMTKWTGAVGVAAIALALPQAPAQAGGDITNFKVKNCTRERIFVCSFDKTDGLMNIPYKARGIQPGDKKEFGCASIGRCKVIIGVSRKTSKKTLSAGMEAALSTASAGAGAVAVGSGGLFLVSTSMATEGVAVGIAGLGGAAAGAIVAIGAGGAVAGIEIADGWSDGEVCNQVKKAARKANLKPKHFMQNNRNYKVIEQYATDGDGKYYANADGTAVFAYTTKKGKSACPAPLPPQIIPNFVKSAQ